AGVAAGCTCWVFAGLAGALLAGAFCAQTTAAGKKSKRAGAIVRPRVESTVIFVIMQGIPQVL
ncbi:MAG: hypothetical protein WAL45_02840, partial [Terracidiphilus sp.]